MSLLDHLLVSIADADEAARSRGGNRLLRWLSSDTAARLDPAPELPVVSLASSESASVRPTAARGVRVVRTGVS
jgi:hypothetical protein